MSQAVFKRHNMNHVQIIGAQSNQGPLNVVWIDMNCTNFIVSIVFLSADSKGSLPKATVFVLRWFNQEQKCFRFNNKAAVVLREFEFQFSWINLKLKRQIDLFALDKLICCVRRYELIFFKEVLTRIIKVKLNLNLAHVKWYPFIGFSAII